MRSHRKITTYRLSPESDAEAAARTITNDDLLLQGHWGKEDAAGPAHKFELFR